MILVITPGDPDGIGPEITWKALQNKKFLRPDLQLLCVGAREPLAKLGAKIVEVDAMGALPPLAPGERGPVVWLLPAPEKAPPGKLLPGFQSGWAIQKAVELIRNKKAQALVTGPISKFRLQAGGFPFEGHTELLAHLCMRPDWRRGSRRRGIGSNRARGASAVADAPTMMLANDQLRVSLVTIHLALKDVARAITEKEIRRAVMQTDQALRDGWGIRKPRIAVTGLNPHCGEQGLFGKEEIRVIAPAIRRLQAQGLAVSGPHPADTFFAQQIALPSAERCDAVVCMYHDQGLIPVKLLDFSRTVNVTLGLPIIRTSVDHGVGFDIAGKNQADPSSLEAAIQLATEMVARS